MNSAIGFASQIEIWAKGDKKKQKIDLLKVSKETSQLNDIQYNKTFTYKGVSFPNLFKEHASSFDAKNDWILLHFNNRMIVPFDRVTLETDAKSVFIATSIKQAAKSKWSSEFPRLSKPSEIYRDPNPIRFTDNKVVVSEKLKNQVFSPWRHVGSLVGIELVNKQAYLHQYPQAKSGPAVEGFEVFKARCQNCHGVGEVGADFGWDFIDPIKIYEKRKPEQLLNHVKYPYINALERGLMMPAQGSFNKKEAEQLWHWLKYIADHPIRPYKLK